MTEAITAIIEAAGEILREGYFASQRYAEKERGHLLSAYDLTVNEYLSERIREAFPDESYYSEEGVDGTSRDRWVVDPIDGTTYFIFGEPYFSISIAHEVGSEVVEGHVYNPISSEHFYGDRESGQSYLNGEAIHVSGVSTVEDAFAGFGFSANMKAIRHYSSEWIRLINRCRKGVAWICPALSICNVARGRVEAFIDNGCSFEGQAAAQLILLNAGGAAYNYDGSPYDCRRKGGIFTNGRLDLLTMRSPRR